MSIAGWAIWQEHSFVWGLIIAGSQVVTAIKRFFPYATRINQLQGVVAELEILFVQMENDWYGVSEGSLSEQSIHRLNSDFRAKKPDIIRKYISKTTLPDQQSLREKAEFLAKQYVEQKY